LSLVRTSYLNAVAVLVRIASALVLNKILAILVGPSGYALIGQIQNVVSIMAGIAGGAISTGVVKATAEHFDDDTRQYAIWRTAFRLSIWTTLLAAALLFLFRRQLGIWLFHRGDLTDVLVWLVLALPAMCANTLFLAILNGKKEVGAYVIANASGTLLALSVTAAMTAAFGIRGALIAVAISPAVAITASVVLISRTPWFRPQYIWGPTDFTSLRELSKYALMMLTTAVCTPIAQTLIRNHLGETIGWESAGYWQAVSKISEIYLMLIIGPLAVYYLPRIAEIRRSEELRSEVVRVYRFSLPLAAGFALGIYLMRDTLVILLFASNFRPMTELFGWQLAGDVVKIASWVLGYVLLGKAAAKAFIATEVLFSISLVIFTWLLTGYFGLKGATMAYFVSYVLYLLILAFVVKRVIRFQTMAA